MAGKSRKNGDSEAFPFKLEVKSSMARLLLEPGLPTTKMGILFRMHTKIMKMFSLLLLVSMQLNPERRKIVGRGREGGYHKASLSAIPSPGEI